MMPSGEVLVDEIGDYLIDGGVHGDVPAKVYHLKGETVNQIVEVESEDLVAYVVELPEATELYLASVLKPECAEEQDPATVDSIRELGPHRSRQELWEGGLGGRQMKPPIDSLFYTLAIAELINSELAMAHRHGHEPH